MEASAGRATVLAVRSESSQHETRNRIGKEPGVAADLAKSLARWGGTLSRPGLTEDTLKAGEAEFYRHHLKAVPP